MNYENYSYSYRVNFSHCKSNHQPIKRTVTTPTKRPPLRGDSKGAGPLWSCVEGFQREPIERVPFGGSLPPFRPCRKEVPARHERKGGGERRLKIILKRYDNAAAFGCIPRIISIQMEKIMAASSQKPDLCFCITGIIPANFLIF